MASVEVPTITGVLLVTHASIPVHSLSVLHTFEWNVVGMHYFSE